MHNIKHPKTILERISTFIVDKRKAFILVFSIALIFCASMIPKQKINNDLSSYLPANTETRVGLSIMEEEFTTYGNAQVMISNITYDNALALSEEFSELEGVMTVTFDNTPDHYTNSSALFLINFAGEETDPVVLDAMSTIKENLADYDVSYDTVVGSNYGNDLSREMAIILCIAAIVIIGVLVFTSKTYFELLIFLIVFAAAAVLNMGTNFIFGKISDVTKAISTIIQLALAVDYAIVLCHRYMEERMFLPTREAAITALSKGIIEIAASSLTTIAGLAALTTMQYRLGFDIGIVLIKGIFFSLISVFLLMPGLLVTCDRFIEATRHRSFVPDVSALGRIVVGIRRVALPACIVILVLATFFSNNSNYVFSHNTIDTNNPSPTRIAQDKIADTFGIKNEVAVLVPNGSYENEKTIVNKITAIPEVFGALGLCNIEINDQFMLTDRVNTRQFAELADVDIELARILFQAYGLNSNEYSAIFSDVDEYSAPLIDIFLFLIEQRDKGVLTLDTDQNERVNEINDTLQDAKVQLEGENWSRIVFTVSTPDEGMETEALLDNIRAISQSYYGKNVVLVSDATLALDQNHSFSSDNLKITVLTALFVMVILLFTFKSVGLPFLLILTIQGSIFINFSFPFIYGKNLYFVSYLIVSAIQMGATIDYAILITNRYQSLKNTMGNKAAVIEAVNQGFPTVITSGTILTFSGYLIGWISTDPVVGSIGFALGRGGLSSMVLVLTLLPEILYVLDSFIEKSALTIGKSRLKNIRLDRLSLDGRIRGNVHGYIDGEFRGNIKGTIDAAIESRQPDKELFPANNVAGEQEGK